MGIVVGVDVKWLLMYSRNHGFECDVSDDKASMRAINARSAHVSSRRDHEKGDMLRQM